MKADATGGAKADATGGAKADATGGIKADVGYHGLRRVKLASEMGTG